MKLESRSWGEIAQNFGVVMKSDKYYWQERASKIFRSIKNCCAQSTLQCCHRACFLQLNFIRRVVGNHTLEDHVELRSFFRCTTTKKITFYTSMDMRIIIKNNRLHLIVSIVDSGSRCVFYNIPRKTGSRKKPCYRRVPAL